MCFETDWVPLDSASSSQGSFPLLPKINGKLWKENAKKLEFDLFLWVRCFLFFADVVATLQFFPLSLVSVNSHRVAVAVP